MKRLVRSKSAKQFSSQKWENSQAIRSKSNSHLLSAPLESPAGAAQVSGVEAASVGNGTGSGWNEESMYRAALEGDWLAAEVILGRDPNLAHDHITEKGDRALHVAAAMKHKKFVRELVEHMTVSDLLLLDGRGYTACCYAAISGVVDIARFMIQKNPYLITTHDQNNVMPLEKAALRGNKEMLSYFLKSIKVEDLSKQEWFDLLLVTIRRRMFDVATKIVEENGSVTTMANEEGTALHLLARQYTSNYSSRSWKTLLLDLFYADGYWYGVEPSSFNKLAKKLWTEMQRIEKASLFELIKKPHILHHAAEAGHVELIAMLTRTYPLLMWEIDGNGHTIFHIGIRYRRYSVRNLIPHVGVMIDLSAMSQDQDGNNILHLAAKLAPLHRVRVPQSTLLMQTEISWFESIRRIVPPSCEVMRNNDGMTPRELFSREHQSLFEHSLMLTRNTAYSFMIIATILLTVTLAVSYGVPGGYDDKTGNPVLKKEKDFDAFISYEIIAVFGSVISIEVFRTVMASSYVEEDFLRKLPPQLLIGFTALRISLLTTILAFMSSIELGHPKINSHLWNGLGNILACFWFLWCFAEMFAMAAPKIPLAYCCLKKRTHFSQAN